LRIAIPQPGREAPKLDPKAPARWTGRLKLDDTSQVWDFIQRLGEQATVVAYEVNIIAESADGHQHTDYMGNVEAGYPAARLQELADKLQEVVGAGALRMTVGALGFATGQDLLDWLKSTGQPFDAAKVQQAA